MKYKIGWSMRGRVEVKAEDFDSARDAFYALAETQQLTDSDGYEVDFVEECDCDHLDANGECYEAGTECPDCGGLYRTLP